MSIEQDQEHFMLRGGQTTAKINHKQIGLYEDLIEEEHNELLAANSNWGNESKELQAECIKEAIDNIVVLLGYLFSMGIDVKKAWRLVWHNNMTKVIEGVEKDENGKIMKSKKSKNRKAKMMEDIKALLND